MMNVFGHIRYGAELGSSAQYRMWPYHEVFWRGSGGTSSTEKRCPRKRF